MDNILNITNYFDHPSRPGHTVFRFYEKEKADYFQELLDRNNVWYESDIHEEEEKTTYFFGVKNQDLKQTYNINHLVSAKYRKPFIPNAYFRWGIFILAILCISLAVIGYLKT